MEDAIGRTYTAPYADPARIVSGVNSSAGTGDTAVIAAQGAGNRIYLSALTVVNESATVATRVDIKDGTTVIWRVFVPINSAHTVTFPVPLRLTANTALNMAAAVAVTTAYFAAVGFVSPV